jgi:RNA polymerase sigma-70 factor (ECF subfamily)
LKLAGDPDEEWFNELWHGCHGRIYRYLVHLLGDQDAAEDRLSETFMTAWRKHRQVPRDHPMPWLYLTARRHAQNYRRSLRRRRWETLVADWRADRRTDDGGIDWSDATMSFVEAARRLPAPYAEILVLRYEHDLDDHTIASIVGKRPDNVRQMLSRAVRKLRQALENSATGGRAKG